MLEIKNLQVTVDGREILNGLDLTVNKGEVHAIMGPNGSGKSTLAYVLAGKDGYEVTGGAVTFDGEDLLALEPDERAAKGVFLAFQYPLEIPGVATMTFLRTALNAQRKKRGEPELTAPEFMKRVREAAAKLGIDQEMLRRPVNVGFSGGEKKRNEILQMALLEPQARGARRDRLRPRHRRAEGRGRRRQPAALARARHDRHHPLPAPARLHRARHRARAVEGPHRAAPAARSWRSSSRPRATPATRTRQREAAMTTSCARSRPRPRRRSPRRSRRAKARLPGGREVAARREAAFRQFEAAGCRTGASRNGNTPTCAR